MEKITLCWLRRDLRLEDNTALHYALQQETNVLPFFIFDANILDKLADKADARVTFIHSMLREIQTKLEQKGSSLLIKYGKPEEIFAELASKYELQAVYANRDYEPYARERDLRVERFLAKQGIPFLTFKDHVIFEAGEILNGTGECYQVFTPYSRAWLGKLHLTNITELPSPSWKNLKQVKSEPFPFLEEIGFEKSSLSFPSKSTDPSLLSGYDHTRDFPAQQGTSRLGIHLRFGTISIRKLALDAARLNTTFLNQLIWREFYMTILAYHPRVVDSAFKPEYDRIPWRNDETEFEAWCEGKTGFPIVDAGMRELNETGYMHNRVRMITASFLTKFLLVDWRWGEAYFAQKLLDYDLAANNGSWQWAAGTGTDAQPYFRIFNPEAQTKKFDPNLVYIKRWIPELDTEEYPKPIVDYKFARQRALDTYKKALAK